MIIYNGTHCRVYGGNNEWMGYAETVVLSKHPSQGTQFRLQKVVVTYVE